MLCPNCHAYAPSDAVRCPRCGMPVNLPDDGEKQEDSDLLSFRQGRHLAAHQQAPQPPKPQQRRRRNASRAMEEDMPDAPQEAAPHDAEKRVYGEDEPFYDSEILNPSHAPEEEIAYGKRAPRVHEKGPKRAAKYLQRGTNWMVVLVCAVVAMIGLAFGAYMFLTKTDPGQVLMARMGREANSAALWQVGEERMNNGDLSGAIDYFVKANEQDGKENANVSGLLMLGNAYEANGELDKAEEVYAYLYTDIVPSASDAYRNQVRIYLAQGREKEAAELLAVAYKATGVTSFNTQRTSILPPTPGASVTAGYYTAKQTITFAVAEDYDVYYTFNDLNQLPEEGTLYTGPIELGEGDWSLRAVSVNGDLVSDVMKGSYQIYMPTPLQPDVSLAPNTYDKRISITLRPGTLTKDQLEKNPGYAATLTDEVAQTITIYYTIDGSTPDEDSPLYTTGEKIKMPGGNVTLKAISVNGYGKSSTIKEVGYKFNKKPWMKTMMTVDDTLGDWKLGTTTKEAFTQKCGDGSATETVYNYTIGMDMEKVTYDWGYACFARLRTANVLVELYMTRDEFTAPRKTQIGSTEDEVVSVYKDFGQVESPSGNRGLYESEFNKGEKIKMPGGNVTLKAISVNGYGKSSTIKEVGYKFNKKPWMKTMMTVDDTLGDWKLGTTTKEAFTQKCGDGSATETVYNYTIGMDMEKVTYDWGYACFARLRTANVLVELYMTRDEFTAPRKTQIGSTEDEVVSVYKDFGQVESPSGNRGLYESEFNKGKIYKQEDGTKIIRYRVETGDSHIWQLDYELNTSGTVDAIRWSYEP